MRTRELYSIGHFLYSAFTTIIEDEDIEDSITRRGWRLIEHTFILYSIQLGIYEPENNNFSVNIIFLIYER